MKTSDLINEFSSRTCLPVDVNDVPEFMRQHGIEYDIEFIGVKFDTEILQGQIKVFERHDVPYGDPISCANIYYHEEHDTDWQRFICCKELLHLLDPTSAQTSSAEDIERLAQEIGLPPEMQNPTAEGFATNVDRVAEFRAAAILLPFASREILLTKYPGDLTLTDIAIMADIPRKWAGLVMSPGWPTIHDILSKK